MTEKKPAIDIAAANCRGNGSPYQTVLEARQGRDASCTRQPFGQTLNRAPQFDFLGQEEIINQIVDDAQRDFTRRRDRDTLNYGLTMRAWKQPVEHLDVENPDLQF
jgi:hypothetical protein